MFESINALIKNLSKTLLVALAAAWLLTLALSPVWNQPARAAGSVVEIQSDSEIEDAAAGQIIRQSAARLPLVAATAPITVDLDTVNPGQVVTITFDVVISDPFLGPDVSVSNQGQVTADDGVNELTDDPNTPAANDPTVTLVDVGDLAVGKYVTGPNSTGLFKEAIVGAGNVISYTVVVSNVGIGSIPAGAAVQDTLPAGVVFGGAQATAGTVGNTGNQVDWQNLPAFNPGNTDAQTLTITATVQAATEGQTIVNPATFTQIPGSDSNTLNNTSTATITVQSADLQVTKSSERDTETGPGVITYTITVNNNGPTDAVGAILSDTIPSGISGSWNWTCVSSGGVSCPNASGGGSINETIGFFSMGGQLVYTVTAALVSTDSLVTNIVSVTTPSGSGDPNPDNNSATDVSMNQSNLRLNLPLILKARWPGVQGVK